MAREKRATWWKMLYHQRAAIESVSDEDAGAGLKAAFRYFDGEDIHPESLSLPAFTVFCVIRPYIDDAWRDYEKSVESGKEGARRRYNSPPIPPLSSPMGVFREEEVEEEVIASTYIEAITSTNKEDSPPIPPLSPPMGVVREEKRGEVNKEKKKYPDDIELVRGEDGKQAWKKKEKE